MQGLPEDSSPESSMCINNPRVVCFERPSLESAFVLLSFKTQAEWYPVLVRL